MQQVTKEDFVHQAGRDPIVEALEALNLPLTRENYLDLLYPEAIPSITAEMESELPEGLSLQKRNIVSGR